MTRKESTRRENEHERREERFERLMNQLQKPDNDKKDNPDSDRKSHTTGDD